MIEKIRQRIAAVAKEACGYAPLTRVIPVADILEIMEQEKEKPQTNADWIRSMTDEELTAFLCNITSNDEGCDSCLAWKYCHKGHTGFEDWLKAESEG